MSTGRDSAAAAAPTAPKKTLKSRYLYMYNLVSFVLWVIVLRRGAMPPPHDPSLVTYVRWTQTFALAEVFHALFGLVRAGIFTTAIQVASRLLLVWGVVWLFPQVLSVDDRNAWVYTGMLVAWGVTECVRYGYFVALLGKNGDASRVPSWLTWMRYNLFFALYPLGISCECWLIWKAVPFAQEWDSRYAFFLQGVLLNYIPGSYILYSHMMSQRKRVLRGKAQVSAPQSGNGKKRA